MGSLGSRFGKTRSLIVGLFLAMLLPTAGCGDGGSSDSEKTPQASVPSSFEEAGRTWTQGEMTTADERLLVDYFNQKPSLAENPTIAGSPFLYRNGSDAVRFYWVEKTPQRINWIRLDRSGGKFVGVEQGSGSPFE